MRRHNGRISRAMRGYGLKSLDVRAAERKCRYARVEDQHEEVKLRLKCQAMMEGGRRRKGGLVGASVGVWISGRDHGRWEEMR
jgi:hypothetical protein